MRGATEQMARVTPASTRPLLEVPSGRRKGDKGTSRKQSDKDFDEAVAQSTQRDVNDYRLSNSGQQRRRQQNGSEPSGTSGGPSGSACKAKDKAKLEDRQTYGGMSQITNTPGIAKQDFNDNRFNDPSRRLLKMLRGDRLSVTRLADEDWVEAYNHRTKLRGMVPRDYVKPIEERPLQLSAMQQRNEPELERDYSSPSIHPYDDYERRRQNLTDDESYGYAAPMYTRDGRATGIQAHDEPEPNYSDHYASVDDSYRHDIYEYPYGGTPNYTGLMHDRGIRAAGRQADPDPEDIQLSSYQHANDWTRTEVAMSEHPMWRYGEEEVQFIRRMLG